MREQALIDEISSRDWTVFQGEVYRATRVGLDPTSYSTAGGRWMPRHGMAVLYTSVTREGALAEISYRLASLTPPPSKRIEVHRLKIVCRRMLTLKFEDFASLGIDRSRYDSFDYVRTAVVGDVVGFLEFDAIRVPSARWDCDNIILLSDHQDVTEAPLVLDTEEVSWLDWAEQNGFL